MEDNLVMAEVRGGNLAKLGVLFERHHQNLFRYFLAMTRSKPIAEDLVQEVFVRILRYKATYDARQSFTAWMYQIARNANVDRTRKHRGEVVAIDEILERKREPVSQTLSPEAAAVESQDVAYLRLALNELPADKKELLVLFRFQGLKHEEIAKITGCESATVKVRIFRAMKALQAAYETVTAQGRKREA